MNLHVVLSITLFNVIIGIDNTHTYHIYHTLLFWLQVRTDGRDSGIEEGKMILC